MRVRASIAGLLAGVAMLVGAAGAGAFPGTNGRIAYVDRDSHIVSMDSTGGDVQQLTNQGGNSSPSWSADGTKIVYSHDHGAHQEIVTMNADGTGKHAVTSKHRDFTPSFSPNGKRIVFARAQSHGEFDFSGIFVVRTNGSHLKELTHDRPVFSDEEQHPSYSPDGTKIVFENLLAEDGGSSIMNSDGTHVRGLGDNNVEPEFTPDGTHVVHSGLFGSSNLGIEDLQGNDDHDFTTNADDSFEMYWPSPSPDGTQVAFAGGRHRSDIYTVDYDGNNMTPLTTDHHAYEPSWGPAAG
jgi:Tol biopolymer transport system component